MSKDLSRWWYCRPRRGWGLKDWLVPFVMFYRCGDEFCNDTLFIRLPLLGHLCIRTGRRPLRVNNKCEECVTRDGPWCPGCRGCHHGPRCHDWLSCDHDVDVNVLRCPACAGDFCIVCEPEPKKTCPNRRETE